MKQMYPSLTAMAQSLERQRDAKTDFLVPREKIHFVSGEEDAGPRSEIDLLGTDAEGYCLTDVCHGQFASRLAVPKDYYDRLRTRVPGLLDETVNTLLRTPPLRSDRDGDGTKPWMIRTWDFGDDGGKIARASLSNTYARIDSYDILERVLEAVTQSPGGGGVQFASGAVTERNLYLKLVVENLVGEVKVGETVRGGLIVRNSETGFGALDVRRFVETLACTNGMVVERQGLLRRVHLGAAVDADGLGRILSTEARVADDRAFLLKVRDVVSYALSEIEFEKLVAEMRAATESEPVADVAAAVEFLAREEDLSQKESAGVLQHLAAGGDLSRWGVLSAVTRTAQDVDSYDRATDLESLGGKILAYSDAQWSRLAEAVA